MMQAIIVTLVTSTITTLALIFLDKYRPKKSIPFDKIKIERLEKQLKAVTELKDTFWITNQELGKQLRELKNEAVHFKKLYVDTWHQNQSLLDMRGENLSFYITVKPNNLKRKRSKA